MADKQQSGDRPERHPTKHEAAARAWSLMSEYALAEFRAKGRNLQDSGLTPGHVKALMTLEPGEARPMGECARHMGCDASTATWLIDRLEERGLVRRNPSATDRRVRTVLLTSLGESTRTVMREHYSRPPKSLLDLSAQELRTLSLLLGKLEATGVEPSADFLGANAR